MTCLNSIFDQNYSYKGTGIEAECQFYVAGITGLINSSQISGNVFRQYNDHLIDNPVHPGVRLNYEGVPGFANLYGPDGEFGTLDDDPSLGEGSESIGRSVLPPDFADAASWELGLFDIADLDGDCDRTEPLPVDIFGNPRAYESVPGEGVNGYAADAGCAEYIPDGSGAMAQDWIVPDHSIVDFSEDPIRLYVDIDAAPGGDGSSWANAMTNPAEALAIAAGRIGPVEIWVAEGAYPAPVSDTNVGAFQIVENATLLGGFAGDEVSADQRDPAEHLTVLTGDVLGNDDLSDPQTFEDNTRQVVISIGRRGGGTVDGFSIEGGYPAGRYFYGGMLFHSWPNGLQERLGGALVFAASGQLVVRNCAIGPIPVDVTTKVQDTPLPMIGMQGAMTSLLIENCDIWSDRQYIPNSEIASIVCDRTLSAVHPQSGWGELLIRDTVFRVRNENRMFNVNFVGTVGVERSRLILDTPQIPAFTIQNSGQFVVQDSTMTSPYNLPLRVRSTDVNLNNSTMHAPGLALLFQNQSPLRSIIVSNNILGVTGNAAIFLPTNADGYEIASNTFSTTVTPQQLGAYGPTNTTFDFESNASAFFLDPLGPDGEPYTGDEDLRLAPGSPAINSGLNEFVTSDFDLDGNERIIGSVVDRGAYEFTGTCTGDVNGDGEVNLGDLNLVLANFGQELPFGDASGDGAVDLADLNIVLAAFGHSCK
ncbi:MAG: choice-of-anchor Q domain-containing protein [Phycisphaerales bacterium JB050]